MTKVLVPNSKVPMEVAPMVCRPNVWQWVKQSGARVTITLVVGYDFTQTYGNSTNMQLMQAMRTNLFEEHKAIKMSYLHTRW